MSHFDLNNYSFKAIIFDCDGTLVNSAPLHFSSFEVVLKRQGVSLDRDWYMDRLGFSRHELISELSAENSFSLDIPGAVAESEAQFLLSTNELTEIPEVVEIAKRCYGKLPMAVASSGQKHSVKQSLRHLEIEHFFDHILTAEDVSVCKPDPEIYIAAMAKLQVEPSECLIFEDTNEGLMSAARAGGQTVDVRTFASIYSNDL